MRSEMAEMPRIALIKIGRTLAESLDKGPEHFESAYQLELGPVTELVRQTVGPASTKAAEEGPVSPWGGYLAIDEVQRSVVGTCAYKGGPKDGTVEIAYFTFPGFEGHGYATAMARRLIECAKESHEVTRIIARTLPELSASTTILKKIGMRLVGDVVDPDDGTVWEWELERW
jgi:RimJ/RimL family protein N-acetyltransferase